MCVEKVIYRWRFGCMVAGLVLTEKQSTKENKGVQKQNLIGISFTHTGANHQVTKSIDH